jgi:hypothetical protein
VAVVALCWSRLYSRIPEKDVLANDFVRTHRGWQILQSFSAVHEQSSDAVNSVQDHFSQGSKIFPKVIEMAKLRRIVNIMKGQ